MYFFITNFLHTQNSILRWIQKFLHQEKQEKIFLNLPLARAQTSVSFQILLLLFKMNHFLWIISRFCLLLFFVNFPFIGESNLNAFIYIQFAFLFSIYSSIIWCFFDEIWGRLGYERHPHSKSSRTKLRRFRYNSTSLCWLFWRFLFELFCSPFIVACNITFWATPKHPSSIILLLFMRSSWSIFFSVSGCCLSYSKWTERVDYMGTTFKFKLK